MRLLPALLLFLCLGCSPRIMTPLNEGESRSITLWGWWAVIYGSPIGIGYLHTERGPNVQSFEPAKPPAPPAIIK